MEANTKLLTPAEGAMVQVGTPVTFSGESGRESPLTFEVASSSAVLSRPDVDGGAGTAQAGGVYSLLSTKATAVPRTIYWAATFTRVLTGCEGPPVTYTTPARALTVTASQPASPVSDPRPPVTRPHSSKCVVPKLVGDSLGTARGALRRAHCVLGKVSRPARTRERLVVTRQNVRAGSTVATGTPVAVKLGRAPRPTRRS
ncbi:MAG: hypothetical protein KGJ43_00980 [Acidobacteriota bacterium]|nr:hypothetical protein [Acidobacteriota bacterium]